MGKAHTKYWTLTQAAAWVIFRNDAVVDKFAPPDPDDWVAFQWYGATHEEWPFVGDLSELFDKLANGQLVAQGRSNTALTHHQTIPAVEWAGLIADVSAPYIRINGKKIVPWVNILIEAAAVQKLWRRPTEVEARTKFNWNKLRDLYDELTQRNPAISQNELIKELQSEYQEQTGKKPPERTTIQRHIKSWTD